MDRQTNQRYSEEGEMMTQIIMDIIFSLLIFTIVFSIYKADKDLKETDEDDKL